MSGETSAYQHLGRVLALGFVALAAVPPDLHGGVVSQCAGEIQIHHTGLGGTSGPICPDPSEPPEHCSGAGAYCDCPLLIAGPKYELANPSCDPQTEACTVKARLDFEFPGNEANGPTITPWILWFKSDEVPPGCNPAQFMTTCPNLVGGCGLPGEAFILDAREATWFEVPGVTCDNVLDPIGLDPNLTPTGVRSVGAYTCPTNNCSCGRLRAVQKVVLGGPQMAAAIGCMPPPKQASCPLDNDCKACLGAGNSTSPAGGGGGATPEESGPGQGLAFAAGGAGGTGAPGSFPTPWKGRLVRMLDENGTCAEAPEVVSCDASGVPCPPNNAPRPCPLAGPGASTALLGPPPPTPWQDTWGRYWSHEFAERIVPDPDETHVWLITRFATFREFTSPDVAGVYQDIGPSDEYRTLTVLTDGGGMVTGWELRSLDGTIEFFDEQGRWTETAARNGDMNNRTFGTYDGVTGQLTAVTFPDGRSLDYTYYIGGPSGGKLESTTEVPVSGTTTAPRVWTYVWTGDDLIRITRPDLTKWELSYNDPSWPGYMTRMDLVTADGLSRRTEGAWEYDAAGNVVQTWSGDTATDGTGDHPTMASIELYSLVFDDADQPTVTTVTNPAGGINTYFVSRDATSLKPKISQITGDCPVCGAGPDSTFVYGDPANPLRPTKVTNGQGWITEYDYDANGQVTHKREGVNSPDPDDFRETTFSYDGDYPAFATLIQQESALDAGQSRETEMHYESATGDLEWSEVRGLEEINGAATPFAYRTNFFRNTAGKVLTQDPPGFETSGDDITTWTYDPARGNLLPLTREDPETGAFGLTSFAYDGLNRRVRVNDLNNVDTDTQYDELGRILFAIQRGAAGTDPEDPPQPGDLATEYVYDDFGDLDKTILPRGNVIDYEYDADGRLTAIERRPDATNPGERIEYVLDGMGNRTKETLRDATGAVKAVTDFEYAPGGCLLSKVIRDPGSAASTTEYHHDCNGNLTELWDANHDPMTDAPTTTYAYDTLDRLKSVTQPWEPGGTVVTSYAYDVQDHLTSVADAEGNVTSYVYSDRDLLTSEDSPASGLTTYTYNEHGELVEQFDARNIDTVLDVDAADRVKEADYGGKLVTYTYGSTPSQFDVGRLIAIERDAGTHEYTYDRFGRTLQDGQLTYGYDVNGNRATITYPNDVVATYGYDAADRPDSLSVDVNGNPQDIVTAATYLPSGPLNVLSLGNGASGVTETHTYDGRYFPETISLSGSLLSWSYTTDAVGNVETIDDLLDSNNSRKYGYQDFQYFLTCAGGPWDLQPSGQCNPTPSGDVLFWTYDKTGNRESEQRDGATADDYVYQPNGTGNTPLLDHIDLGVGGTRTYTYGPAGHLIAVGSGANIVHFELDKLGRMDRAYRLDLDPDIQTSFMYDGRQLLERVEETEFEAIFFDGFESGDPCAWNVAEGWGGTCPPPPPPPLVGPFRSLDVIYSSEGMLQLTTDDADLSSYVFYLGSRPVALLRWDGSTETWSWLTTDHLGTPIVATDLAGAVSWEGGFEPFGGDYSGAQAAGVFLRLPGQWFDDAWATSTEGARVYHNGYRWYEFGTERYTRTDPILRELSLAALSLDPPHRPSFNLPALVYGYSGSNPLAATDPLGLAHCLYSIGSHTLTCRFKGGFEQTVGPEGVFSGLGRCTNNPSCQNLPDLGPIRVGLYRMNLDERPGHDTWWRLEPIPTIPGWKVRLGLERGGFALHSGGTSLGCITVDRNNREATSDYDSLYHLLLGEWDRNHLHVVE